MTEQTRFDRVLPGLFDDLAAARTPDYLEAAIERATSRDQRPAWTYAGRWLPMDITTRGAPVARMPWRQLGVLALIGLLIALATVAYVGSRPATPSPVLLARGTFDLKDWGPVEFEATREGSNVTGRMTIGLEERNPANPDQSFVTVDLECALTTEDGVVLIGGYSMDRAVHGEGTPFAIALRRGSPMGAPPMRAQIWSGTLDYVPATQGTDCLAYIDWWMRWMPTAGTAEGLSNVDGTIEFGP
jgi:hypothetical protein